MSWILWNECIIAHFLRALRPFWEETFDGSF